MVELWLVLGSLAFAIGAEQQPADFLDEGIVVSARPSFERDLKKGQSLFNLDAERDSMLIRILDQHAYGNAVETVSSDWARVLTTGAMTSVRLADASLLPGTAVDDGSLRDIAICVPPNGGQALVSRDPKNAVYLFRCVAFRESQQIRKDGALVSEIDLVVTTRSGARTDSFLSQTRKVLYARLE